MQLPALSFLTDNSVRPASFRGWENFLSYVTQYLCTNLYWLEQRRGIALCPRIHEFRKLFEGPKASLVCPSGKSYIWMKMSVEHWWNDTDRGKSMYWGKTCPSATLSTRNFTRTDPGSNPNLRVRTFHPELYINTQSVPRSKHTPSQVTITSQLMLYREIIEQQQDHKLSTNLYDIYHHQVYSE
jgi:hypothetical protein